MFDLPVSVIFVLNRVEIKSYVKYIKITYTHGVYKREICVFNCACYAELS